MTSGCESGAFGVSDDWIVTSMREPPIIKVEVTSAAFAAGKGTSRARKISRARERNPSLEEPSLRMLHSREPRIVSIRTMSTHNPSYPNCRNRVCQKYRTTRLGVRQLCCCFLSGPRHSLPGEAQSVEVLSPGGVFQKNRFASSSKEKTPGPKMNTMSDATRNTYGSALVNLSGSEKMEWRASLSAVAYAVIILIVSTS